MPFVIDYPFVLDALRQRGMRNVYYHGGAFEFEQSDAVRIAGWICADDPTLRPEARALARLLPEPGDMSLVDAFERVWHALRRPRAWFMPTSHWAYELDYGHPRDLPALLEAAGVDPAQLAHRNDASAIEFGLDDRETLPAFLRGLLAVLQGSDFTIALPDRDALCTIHHHKQLWWRTTDAEVARLIEA